MVPLPVWKRKFKKHAKRKVNNSAPASDKRQKIDEFSGTLEPGLGLTPSAPEHDSIVTVRSQIVLWEIKEPESSDTVMKDILEMISEPSGSEELNGELSVPKLKCVQEQ